MTILMQNLNPSSNKTNKERFNWNASRKEEHTIRTKVVDIKKQSGVAAKEDYSNQLI